MSLSITASKVSGLNLYSAFRSADRPAPSSAAGAEASVSVEISSEARERLAADRREVPLRFRETAELLRNNPNKAEVQDFVKQISRQVDEPLVAIGGAPEYRKTYSGTDIPVTPELDREFQAKGVEVRAGRMSIYAAEMAKGTDPVDIYEKMMEYTNSMPESYLEKMAWRV